MKPIHQIVAIAVASGVAVASLALPSAAAPARAKPAPTTKDPTVAAASYLASNLATKGKFKDLLTTKFNGKTYADYGETADALLSMTASRRFSLRDRDVANQLAKHATDYAGTMPNVEPGAAAKLLLVAEAQHRDPENFGGLDLIGAIVGDEGAGGGAPGQYVNPDDTQYSSSVINQSLAVLALANTTNTAGQPSAEAVSFLGGQQCADGGFQNAIRSGSTACDPAAEQVDATSYAIQALIVGGDRSRAADALSWLGQAENNNGGWDGVSGKSDANSTALAVESLVAGHKNDGAGLAWLSRAQLGCSSSAGKRGAVQSDGKTYDVSTAVRATSQAGVALAGLSLTGVDRNGGTKAEPVLACPKHHKKK